MSCKRKLDETNDSETNPQEDQLQKFTDKLTQIMIDKAGYTSEQLELVNRNLNRTFPGDSETESPGSTQGHSNFLFYDPKVPRKFVKPEQMMRLIGKLDELVENQDLWSFRKTRSLIKAYKSLPILWDQKFADDKYTAEKKMAWQVIGSRFETSPENVQHKLKNLISEYIQEKKYVQRMRIRYGKVSFQSKWFAFEHLKFLDNVNIKSLLRDICEEKKFNRVLFGNSNGLVDDTDKSESNEEERFNDQVSSSDEPSTSSADTSEISNGHSSPEENL